MNYPLEENKIFANKSKDAHIRISGDKYKFYPQYFPNVQCQNQEFILLVNMALDSINP